MGAKSFDRVVDDRKGQQVLIDVLMRTDRLTAFRFVLANTEVLHEKISELSSRVRQLEDGLAQSQALHSSSPHPLLTTELLAIKRPLERDRLNPPRQEKVDASNDGVDAIGSLYVALRLCCVPAFDIL